MTIFDQKMAGIFVDIDERRCVGCGLCEENHPEIFEMGKRFAMVKQPIVSEEQAQAIINTADDCPADAIIVER